MVINKSKSEFSKNVLTLMTGTTIAQAIPIAISPILTRIYTPEDFGVFALFISISSLLSVIATAKYEFAIMLPRKDRDAVNILFLSIVIVLFATLLSLLIVFFFNHQITSFLGNKEISDLLYILPVTIFLTGVYQSLNFWYNRKKEYGRLAASKVLQSVTTSSINLSAGFAGFNANGLIAGSILGQFVSTGILAKIFWKEERKRFSSLRILRMIALGKKYIDFPKINMLHSFFDMAKVFIVNILLAKFYDIFVLGQFYMVNKILLIPSSLIGSSLSQVLFRTMSDKYNKKQDFSRDVLSMIIKLFLLSLIPFLIIVFFSKVLFIFIFGESWAFAGELSASFALFVLFQFVVSPVSTVPMIVKKQKEAFYINLIGMGLYLGSICIGYLVFDDLSKSLLLLSVIMSIYFTFLLVWIYKISKIYRNN